MGGLGVLIFEMLVGESPFLEMTKRKFLIALSTMKCGIQDFCP